MKKLSDKIIPTSLERVTHDDWVRSKYELSREASERVLDDKGEKCLYIETYAKDMHEEEYLHSVRVYWDGKGDDKSRYWVNELDLIS